MSANGDAELQAQLAEAEADCAKLRAENDALRAQLAAVRQRDAVEAADRLIAELQRQLLDVVQRNSFLEQETQAEHNALLRSYEGYIKRLEDELQRYQTTLSHNKNTHM